MKLIEKLSEMVDEEIGDAHKYAKCALEYKDTHPNLSKVFFDLSGAEMQHMTMLHTEVAKLIEKYRQEKGEPPESANLHEYKKNRGTVAIPRFSHLVPRRGFEPRMKPLKIVGITRFLVFHL